ncbi:craniofacial development protein 2-like [Colias croceus]|uniref:craniofacial development protein 2-like n=1 Tax=Colias crocea TaxID=72248 RepID=UPI001E27B551|nr:craniofacial development protein 2-like [Colias croceus]
MKIEMQNQTSELTNTLLVKMEEKLKPVVEENHILKLKVEKLEKKVESLEREKKKDYSKETLEIRKSLQPQLMQERQKGNLAYIKYDKLIVKENSKVIDKRKREKSTSPQVEAKPKKQQMQSTSKNKLTYTLQKIKIDILGLAEVRRMGYVIEEHENYIFCYKGKTLGLYGVGFLIKKEYKDNIVSFTALSDRVALLNIKYNNQMLTIIQVYAPTEKATDEEINLFYETLQVAQSQAADQVLVIGDFNAKIGKPTMEDSDNIVLGKFGYGIRNERGEKLIQYALEHKLTIMNSFFKSRNNRKWT